MLKTILIIGFLVSPCYSQVQQITNTKGQIDSVALKNVLDETEYRNELKLDKSSATVTYAPLSGNRTFAGFTGFGTGNTQVKVKIVSGTTPGTEGLGTDVAHGLTGDKIVGLMGIIRDAANNGVADGSNGNVAGYEYGLYYDATDIQLLLHATDSESILSKPFVVMIWYIE